MLRAAVCGFLLDLILGDPEMLTGLHPVVWMGKGIRFWEGALRRVFPDTGAGKRAAGAVMAAVMAAGTLAVCGGILLILDRFCPAAGFALRVIWCWQALAVKNLRDEAMNVCRTLREGTLAEARQAVARIVGRDTAVLDAAGVTRAAVETVAENFSDGVIAPLFYMLIGGAPLALCYKAVNTMDSMVGYKNEKYLDFGRAAAKLDDAANFLPARLAALLLIAAAGLTGQDMGSALRIWRRDRRNHASPNSAQCEAAAAGALGVRLAGPAQYFGTVLDKPYIGDPLREIETEDISRVCRMELAGSVLGLALGALLRCAVVAVWKTVV